jgi:outer membrane protein OmpA-like peptidoglycan-associated protein
MRILVFLAISLFTAQLGYTQIQNGTDSAKLIIEFTDTEQNPLTNRMLVVTNQGSDDQEFKGKTDENGKVVIRVPKGNQYQVVYRAVDGPVEFQAFKIPDRRGRLTFTFNPQYERVKDRIYTLQDVYFNTDKATLRESSYDALNDLLSAMQTNKAMRVEIAGHTDDRASAEYNKDLSQRRAESVKAYLVENGIAKDRIRAKGYGESEPVASNETEEGRQKNRRVEVRVLKQ